MEHVPNKLTATAACVLQNLLKQIVKQVKYAKVFYRKAL